MYYNKYIVSLNILFFNNLVWRMKLKENKFEKNLTLREKRIFGILSIVLFIIFSALLGWFIGRPMIKFVSDPEIFREWVDSHGFMGKLLFIGMVFFQVVIAIIPGEPLEIGAGYAFGAIEGTILTMIGITLGSALIFILVKKIGIKIVEVFFPLEKIRSLKFLQNSKKINFLTFIIFFVPGTPKDLLSYFIGLTDIKFSSWILIAAFARIPSIVTSTFGGNALGEQKYKAAIIIFTVAIIVSVIGWSFYKIICNIHNHK